MVEGQLVEHRPPGVRAVPDAVDEQEGRAGTGVDVGPAIAVDGAVLHRRDPLTAEARAVAHRWDILSAFHARTSVSEGLGGYHQL